MKRLKQVLTVALVAALVVSTAACKSQTSSTASGSASTSSAAKDWSKASPIKFTVFSQTANFTGTQGGWFGKVVKDKFNITLQILSGQGQGANLFATRSAAGDLGDIVILGNLQNFTDSIKYKLLADMTPLLATEGTYIDKTYKIAVDRMKKDYGNGTALYGMPNQVSTEKATTSADGNDLTFGNYLLYSAYKAAGSPTINTLEDLLPALQAMQKARPKADNGKQTYGFSLFKDWDGTMMSNVKQYTCLYGYDEWGFALIKADGSEYQSILDPKGQYYRNLQLYHNANKLGLLDPDSYAQNHDTFDTKLKNGQTLSNWWPWACQADYNSNERTSKDYKNTATGVTGPDGYVLIPIGDQTIISNGFSPSGTNYQIAIGSKCQDKDRAMAFLNWMYSPEGVETAFDGPKGLTWELKDGKPVLTEFGNKALNNQADTKVPEEWGGGTYKDGMCQINDFKFVAENGTDPNFGEPYLYSRWASYQAAPTDLMKEWSSTIGGGATTVHQFLDAKKMITVAPGTPIQYPVLSTSQNTKQNNIQTIIKNYSWKMVMTKSDSEFTNDWNSMIKEANAAGLSEVDAVYKAQWEKLSAARKAEM